MSYQNTYYTNVLDIFPRQKRLFCIIGNAKYNDHTSKLFHNLNILTIFQIVKLPTGIMMHRAFNNELPHNIQLYFNISSSENEHRIR